MFADQKDKLFCEIGVDLGFITQEQVEMALEKQKIDRSVGVNSPIGGYLFKENIISREQIRQILKMQGKMENAATLTPPFQESSQETKGTNTSGGKGKDGESSGYMWPVLITIAAVIGFFFIGGLFLLIMFVDFDKDLLQSYHNDFYKASFNKSVEIQNGFSELIKGDASQADVLQFLKYKALPGISEKLTEAEDLTPPIVCKDIHKDFAGSIKRLKVVVEDLIRCVEAQNPIAYLTSVQEFSKIFTELENNRGELAKLSEKHGLVDEK